MGNQSLVPCLVLVDPIPDLINEAGTDVTTDPVLLAAGGTVVTGSATDAASRLLIRIYANSPGDQLTVTLSGDGQENSNGLPQPFGYLETVLPVDGMMSGSQVTATAVNTGAGPMAFAVYHPPSSFSRGGADNTASSRVVTITINANATAARFSTPIYLLRPPVVLVHGIWGSFADWLPFSFDPQALPLLPNTPIIGQFFTEIADYTSPLPPGAVINQACPTTCPQYGALTLSVSPVLSNSMGFSFNAPTVLDQIAKAISDYRANKNATATQADVIAHSMGGLVTLTAVEQSNFVGRMAYGKGRIERLITIGTPYLGSPVATQALQGNSCVTDKLALAGKYAILRANTNPPQGGIGDLQGCPNGSLTGCMNALCGQLTDPTGGPVPSLSIQLLHPQSYNGVQVPAAYIGAYETAVNTSALDVSSVAAGIKAACPNNPLAQNLTGALWKQNIFGGLDSDGVVSVISQMNGASTSPPNFLTPNDIHSQGLETLGFAGPTEQQDAKIASQVFQLLNMPTSQFTLIPSSGGGN